jgi:hypothetical protein
LSVLPYTFARLLSDQIQLDIERIYYHLKQQVVFADSGDARKHVQRKNVKNIDFLVSHVDKLASGSGC